MKIRMLVRLVLFTMPWITHPWPAWAVEEGQFVKKDGKWEYYSGEDSGRKSLYQKGIITEEECNKGLRIIEMKERLSRLNFGVDVNNGLNIRVGERFFLKRCLLTQARTTSAHSIRPGGTVGDSRNPEILGGQVEFSAIRHQSNISQFFVQRLSFSFRALGVFT